eukprot:RCo007430
MVGVTTVSVFNIPPAVVEHRLRGFFSRCGEIRRMKYDREGYSCAATIEFVRQSSFEEALRMNGAEIDGSELIVIVAAENLSTAVASAPSIAASPLVRTPLPPLQPSSAVEDDDGEAGD